MKTGNIGQAVALSVVAVGAIGFLVIQLRGRGAQVAALTPRSDGLVSNVHTASLELPRSVYGDPFTHSALPRRKPSKPADKPALKLPSEREIKLPKGIFGSEQLGDNNSSQNQLGNGAIGGGTDKEAPPKTPPPDKGTPITLSAIVSEPKPVAFISINGKPPRAFVIGRQVLNDATISKIGPNSIELQLPDGPRSLLVGGTTKI